MRYIFLAALLGWLVGLASANLEASKTNEPAATISSFIVQPSPAKKGMSKTVIKEEIGQNIKEALERCVALLKTVGHIQIELANLQSNLFEKVEELIDNRMPFKKANRIQLKETLGVLHGVNTKLQGQMQGMQKVRQQMNQDCCLKRV